MPEFHVEEMSGENVVARYITRASDAKSALGTLVDGRIAARADQQRWFRVVDEDKSTVHEFVIDEAAGNSGA